jgi:hypothetical protein
MRLSGRRRSQHVFDAVCTGILAEKGRVAHVEPVQQLPEPPGDPYDELTLGEKVLVALHATPTPIALPCGVRYDPKTAEGQALRARAETELLAAGVVKDHELARVARNRQRWQHRADERARADAADSAFARGLLQHHLLTAGAA